MDYHLVIAILSLLTGFIPVANSLDCSIVMTGIKNFVMVIRDYALAAGDDVTVITSPSNCE